jgi:2-dehydro-3-deoxyphosphogluconate aldolase/(4S)-4-hydroxy-2-oxoglutarate aldolase
MSDVIQALGQLGVVPVVKIERAEQAEKLAEALQAGGLPCAEITFRTAAAEEAISRIARASPNVIVGAGTVIGAEQAKRAAGAGARFIVSPGFEEKVVDWCQAHKMPVMPGIATPTEILMALGKGIDLVKFFPAEALGGVPVLEAIAAAFGGVRFVPTGGITAENLAAYLKLPMVFACGGSWLVAGKLLNAGAFDEITRLTREAVGIVRSERGPSDPR